MQPRWTKKVEKSLKVGIYLAPDMPSCSGVDHFAHVQSWAMEDNPND